MTDPLADIPESLLANYERNLEVLKAETLMCPTDAARTRFERNLLTVLAFYMPAKAWGIAIGNARDVESAQMLLHTFEDLLGARLAEGEGL